MAKGSAEGAAEYTRGVLALQKSYNFVDKVEIIDELRTAIDDAGYSVAFIANKSGVTKKTLYKWFAGKTQRPQYPTLNAVGKIVGIQLKWVKS